MRICRILLLVIVGSCLAWSQSERSLIGDGNRMYRDRKFSDAEASYRKALEKNKELQQGAFNLGDALYKQERYAEAAEQYNIAASRTADRSVKAQGYHNLGNALLKSQRLPESIAAYKDALKLNPSDGDTKYNLEYAKALLKQQQQNKNQKNDDKQKQDKNQQKQPKQDQQKQDQQKQDQQKQDQQKQDQQQQAQKQNPDQQKGSKKTQISKEDAERILEALKNEEKDVQKKLHKKVPGRVKVEKDW